MNWDFISQIALPILSISAMILVARKNKWGFVLGFLSQPFWIITSYINNQWGVFFVSIIYTFTWAYGIHQWFYKLNDIEKK